MNKHGSHSHNFKDMTGCRFGNIEVIEYVGRSNDRKALWRCKCLLCGTEFVCSGKNIRTGNTRSCGCLQRKSTIEHNSTHGVQLCKHGKQLSHIYYDMVRRCYNPSRKNYANYGGRGIYVVPEWYTPGIKGNPGLVNFYNWAIAHNWHPGVEIDRIDNDGPYAPWNCRLVDRFWNSNNRRNNRYISDGEELLTFGQFEHKYHLPKGYVRARIIDRHWKMDAVVHSAHRQDLQIRQSKTNMFSDYVDSDGFAVLIPRYSKDVKKGDKIYRA